jgi:hypothetical protein
MRAQTYCGSMVQAEYHCSKLLDLSPEIFWYFLFYMGQWYSAGTCEISSPHPGEYEDDSLLGYGAT